MVLSPSLAITPSNDAVEALVTTLRRTMPDLDDTDQQAASSFRHAGSLRQLCHAAAVAALQSLLLNAGARTLLSHLAACVCRSAALPVPVFYTLTVPFIA